MSFQMNEGILRVLSTIKCDGRKCSRIYMSGKQTDKLEKVAASSSKPRAESKEEINTKDSEKEGFIYV